MRESLPRPVEELEELASFYDGELDHECNLAGRDGRYTVCECGRIWRQLTNGWVLMNRAEKRELRRKVWRSR